ncbi:hypothetical protein C8J56DRAFT_65089 [Mycena floridula]|nr:hypothetical protein C8J56DRAFT_65089 [Mycena floridula]
MTEYDHSPEAYQNLRATQERIARWVDETEANKERFESPFGGHSGQPHSAPIRPSYARRRSSSVGAIPQREIALRSVRQRAPTPFFDDGQHHPTRHRRARSQESFRDSLHHGRRGRPSVTPGTPRGPIQTTHYSPSQVSPTYYSPSRTTYPSHQAVPPAFGVPQHHAPSFAPMSPQRFTPASPSYISPTYASIPHSYAPGTYKMQPQPRTPTVVVVPRKHFKSVKVYYV